MKAKELAKFLMQHPEAEVVTETYIGANYMVKVDCAELYSKGQTIPKTRHTAISGIVEEKGKCNVDVIYLGREGRERM